MRYLLTTIAFAAFAVSAHSATPAQEAEFRSLETQLRALALSVSVDTTPGDIMTAFGQTKSRGSMTCSSTCEAVLTFTSGKAAPFTVFYQQHSNKVNIRTHNPDQPFKGEKARLTIELDMKAAPDLCFSQTQWTESLTAAGWPPLTQSTVTRTLHLSGYNLVTGREKPKPLEVPVAVAETLQGTKRITLSAAPDIYRYQQEMTAKQLKAAQALGDCARVLTVEVD